MTESELKLLIGEVVIEHLEQSSQEGLLSDKMPQEHQQELFDNFVKSFYEGISSKPAVRQELSMATSREEVKNYLVQTIFKAMGKVPLPPKEK